jgi:hypothetical protein
VADDETLRKEHAARAKPGRATPARPDDRDLRQAGKSADASEGRNQVKELTEVVNGRLGLLMGGVVIVSLLGSILPTLRLFFAERREARFGDYLRGGDTAARKLARAPRTVRRLP